MPEHNLELICGPGERRAGARPLRGNRGELCITTGTGEGARRGRTVEVSWADEFQRVNTMLRLHDLQSIPYHIIIADIISEIVIKPSEGIWARARMATRLWFATHSAWHSSS